MRFVPAIRLLPTALALLVAVSGPATANDLIDIYHKAAESDATLQAARHQRDVSVEARPQALAALLPQLTGQAGIDRNRLHQFDSGGSFTVFDPVTGQPITSGVGGIDIFNSKTYGLSLTQVLFDWSAFQALGQADQLVAEAQETYRSAQQALIFRVADAYFTALNAGETLRSDLASQDAYERQLEQAQKKFDIGMAVITDVRNAQASLDAGEATIIADRRILDSSQRALGQIVGKPVPVGARLLEEIPLEMPDPVSEDQWATAALLGNPDLLTLFHAAEAARKGVQAQFGTFLPRIGITGSIVRQDSDYRFGSDQLNDSIGVLATWPIFEGGLRVSQLRASRAEHERALSQYEAQRRAVDRATRDAYEGVISGIAGVKATRQSVISFRTSFDASSVGLKVGTRTQADVLNAQRDLSNAQRLFYGSRYDYLRSALLLKQLSGQLAEADLLDIDRLLVVMPLPEDAMPPAPAAKIEVVPPEPPE